jgi:hypothetical protein
MNDGDGRARRSWGGVAGVGEDDTIDIGIEKSTTTTLISTREALEWCPFALEVHGFAGKARRKIAGI